MASRRRNPKTHPKPTGDDGQDTFMPPDRPDRNLHQAEGRTEVVDVFGGNETVPVNGDGGNDVDLNSAIEGDSRSMAHEGGGDDNGNDGRRAGVAQSRGRDASDRNGRGATRGNGDGDSGSYSERVRRRIDRERGLVNRERALRQETQRQLAAERTARQAQEERIARLERAQTSVAGNASVKELEGKIEALRPQLATAMEAGETAKVLELQEKISDLKSELAVLRYDLQQKQRQAEAETNNTRGQGTEQVDRTAVIDDPAVAEIVEQFKKANRHWWNRSGNKAAREDAITIDKEILADIENGDLDFAPYSDEHFEEVARRLHKTYPDLEIQDLEGQPYNFEDAGEAGEDEMNDSRGGRGSNGGNGTRATRGAAPVNRMGQNGRRGPSEVDLARKGSVIIDDDDRHTMRLFKMDPNDPVAKKYFALEKARSILRGDRQAGGNR